MCGCLIVGLLVVLLFVLVPLPLWPLLVVGLVVLVVAAAALGLLKGVLGVIIRRQEQVLERLAVPGPGQDAFADAGYATREPGALVEVSSARLSPSRPAGRPVPAAASSS